MLQKQTLTAPLLASNTAQPPPLLLQYINRLPTAAFLTVLADVTAASFGGLLLPAASGLPPSLGMEVYLLSTIAGQVGLCLSSGVRFATSGATLELVPLLVGQAALVDADMPTKSRAATILAMFSMNSLLVGLMYHAVGRLRLGGLFRCIPLIVLKAALTGIGVFMVIEGVKTGAGELAVNAFHDVDALWQLLSSVDGLCRIATTLGAVAGLAMIRRCTASPLGAMAFLAALSVLANALPLFGLRSLGSSWWFGDAATRLDDIGGGGGGGGGGSDGDGGAALLSPRHPPFGLLPLFSFAAIHMPTLAKALPYSLSCCLIHSLATVTDLVSVEAITAFDMDLDRELASIGTANLLSSMIGGIPNYMQLSYNVLSHDSLMAEAGNARISPWYALLATLSLFVLSDVVAAVPRPVVGAFMAHLGGTFVYEGVETWAATPDPIDKLALLLIPTLMTAVGFLEGLLLGLTMSLIYFISAKRPAPLLSTLLALAQLLTAAHPQPLQFFTLACLSSELGKSDERYGQIQSDLGRIARVSPAVAPARSRCCLSTAFSCSARSHS